MISKNGSIQYFNLVKSGGGVLGRPIHSMRSWFVLLLLICSADSMAQRDAFSELSKIREAYSQPKGILFRSTITMYKTGNLWEPLDKISCQYALKGANYYCKIGPIELVKNNEYFVSVDHEDQYLKVGDARKIPTQQDAFITGLSSLKQLLANKSFIGEISSKGNQSILILTAAANAYTDVRKYTVYYRSGSYLIDRVLMEVNQVNDDGNQEEVTLETVYSYSQIQQVTEIDNFLNLSRFVEIKGNTIELGAAYKKYQLINQL